MHEPTLEQVAQDTAKVILKRHAPDCLDRHDLRDAIAAGPAGAGESRSP
jgi:hypothetical protein